MHRPRGCRSRCRRRPRPLPTGASGAGCGRGGNDVGSSWYGERRCPAAAPGLTGSVAEGYVEHVFGELVRVREQLVLLAAQPAAGLGRQDLQAALVELRAVTGLAAGLTAALAHDLGLRGAAVVVDRAAGTQVEVEPPPGWAGPWRPTGVPCGRCCAAAAAWTCSPRPGPRCWPARSRWSRPTRSPCCVRSCRWRHPTTRSGSCCGPRTAGRHRGTWRCCRSRSGTAPTPTAAPTPSRSATTPGTCA